MLTLTEHPRPAPAAETKPETPTAEPARVPPSKEPIPAVVPPPPPLPEAVPTDPYDPDVFNRQNHPDRVKPDTVPKP